MSAKGHRVRLTCIVVVERLKMPKARRCALLAVGTLLALTAVASRAGPGFVPSDGRAEADGAVLARPASARSAEGITKITANNWAGYAQVGTDNNHFTGVEGYWHVPAVNTGEPGVQKAVDWLGIDGVTDTHKLVQAGTESDNIDGTAKYFAWYELLPALPQVIPLAVHAGDFVDVYIEEVGANQWFISVGDGPTASWSHTYSYSTPGQDVEAVHERPTLDHHLLTLAKTGNVTFGVLLADTGPPGKPYWASFGSQFSGAVLERISMTAYKGGPVIARPSKLTSDGCFAVADGSKPPPPPGSRC
jgi:Peptidase A4 family